MKSVVINYEFVINKEMEKMGIVEVLNDEREDI
jgi:hypothetical protein